MDDLSIMQTCDIPGAEPVCDEIAQELRIARTAYLAFPDSVVERIPRTLGVRIWPCSGGTDSG